MKVSRQPICLMYFIPQRSNIFTLYSVLRRAVQDLAVPLHIDAREGPKNSTWFLDLLLGPTVGDYGNCSKLQKEHADGHARLNYLNSDAYAGCTQRFEST